MLRLRTFGGLSLEGADGPLTGRAVQPRRLALLTILATANHGRGISRDALQALLWPESDAESARHSLYQALHVVRHDLGADDLIQGSAELRLNAKRIQSDVSDFQACLAQSDQAVQLYAGPFLQGFFLRDSAEFDRWVEGRRDEFARAWHAAVESLAEHATNVGNPRAAAEWWRRLADADPLDTRAALGLVTSLAAAGDRSAALMQAEHHTHAMKQDLGVAPDSAFTALCQRLRDPPPGDLRPATPAPITQASALPVPQSLDTLEPVTLHLSRSPPALRWRRYSAIAVLGSTLVLAAALWVQSRRESPGGEVRLALMPFENLGVSSDGYFVRGLSEEIKSRLAGVAGLHVITHSLADSNTTAAHALAVGRDLRVDFLLTGAVRWERDGDNAAVVRVTPRLVRVRDGRALWGEALQSDLRNVFELQERIAERVARALDLTLTPGGAQATAPPTRSPEAYVLYLQANDFRLRPYFDPRDIESAARLYRQAIQLDGQFAEAYAGLSATHQKAIWRGHDTSDERMKMAREAAESAVALKPALGVAHLVLGLYYGGVLFDFQRGLKELQLAARFSPNDPAVLEVLGGAERRMGLYWDAAEHLSQASLLNPQSSNAALAAGLSLAFVHQYSSAERWIDRAIMLAPDWGLPYAAKAQLYLAWRGDTVAARKVIHDALSTASLADIMGHLGYSEDVGFALFLVADDSRLRKAAQNLTAGDFRRFASDTGFFWLTRAYLCRMEGQSGCARAYSDSAAGYLRSRVTERPEDSVLPVQLGIALAGGGQRQAALRMADRALTVWPVERDVVGAADRGPVLAQLYLLADAPERAIAELERLLKEPSALSPEELRVDPTWDPLREEPRFQALLLGSGSRQSRVASQAVRR